MPHGRRISAVPDGTWFFFLRLYPELALWAVFCCRFAAGVGWSLSARLKPRPFKATGHAALKRCPSTVAQRFRFRGNLIGTTEGRALPGFENFIAALEALRHPKSSTV